MLPHRHPSVNTLLPSGMLEWDTQSTLERVATNTFGEWLQQEMKRVGVRSQADLAERVHVTRATVSKWIKGTRIPDRDSAAAIARALNVSRMLVYQKLGWTPSVDDQEWQEWMERLDRLSEADRRRLAAIAEALLQEGEGSL